MLLVFLLLTTYFSDRIRVLLFNRNNDSKGASQTNSVSITRNLLEMQILRPCLRPVESEPPGVRSTAHVSTSDFDIF